MRAAIFSSLVVVLGACSGKATCPVAVPQAGATCGDRGLSCETGGDAHHRCSTVFACTDALDTSNPTRTAWKVTLPDASCTNTNDPQCPSDFNTAPTGKPCPQAALSCDYTSGRCTCAPCNPTASYPGGLAWQCRPWTDSDIGSSCPADRPTLGSACPVNGVLCNYDSACTVSFGPDLLCIDGLWQPRGGAPRTCGIPVCGITI